MHLELDGSSYLLMSIKYYIYIAVNHQHFPGYAPLASNSSKTGPGIDRKISGTIFPGKKCNILQCWGVMPLCRHFIFRHTQMIPNVGSFCQLARLKCHRTWDATFKNPKNHQRNCIQHPFGTLNMILVLDIFRESSKMYELAGTYGSNMSYHKEIQCSQSQLIVLWSV